MWFHFLPVSLQLLPSWRCCSALAITSPPHISADHWPQPPPTRASQVHHLQSSHPLGQHLFPVFRDRGLGSSLTRARSGRLVLERSQSWPHDLLTRPEPACPTMTTCLAPSPAQLLPLCSESPNCPFPGHPSGFVVTSGRTTWVRISLVVQWLRICLANTGYMGVRSLIREQITHAMEQLSPHYNYWACGPQLESLYTTVKSIKYF